MCSPASAKFTSIVTILVCFEVILMYFKSCGWSLLWKLTFKVDSYRKPLQNCFKTYKYCANTCEYYTRKWSHYRAGEYTQSFLTLIMQPIFIRQSPFISKIYQVCHFTKMGTPTIPYLEQWHTKRWNLKTGDGD